MSDPINKAYTEAISNTPRKYELLQDDTIKVNGKTLYRIKYLKTVGPQSANSLGGYIEGEHNLSHTGKCIVFGEKTMVYGEAKVMDNAQVGYRSTVRGKSEVTGNSNLAYADVDNSVIKNTKLEKSDAYNVTLINCSLYKAQLKSSKPIRNVEAWNIG
jgi:hypothetical protein